MKSATQHELDLKPQIPLRFDGPGLEPFDIERLGGQLRRVYELLSTGEWYTLARLAELVRGSEAGVSARLRDLKKRRFGSHLIEKRRVIEGRGLWEYRRKKESA